MGGKVQAQFSQDGIVYRLELTNCGNKRCKKCCDDSGVRRKGVYVHGPYWYAIFKSHGERISKYIGRECKTFGKGKNV